MSYHPENKIEGKNYIYHWKIFWAKEIVFSSNSPLSACANLISQCCYLMWHIIITKIRKRYLLFPTQNLLLLCWIVKRKWYENILRQEAEQECWNISHTKTWLSIESGKIPIFIVEFIDNKNQIFREGDTINWSDVQYKNLFLPPQSSECLCYDHMWHSS